MPAIARQHSATDSTEEEQEVRVEVKDRSDVGNGFYEVTVTVDDRSKGSSFVVTAPRRFAFREKVVG
jgi:hypothetical protein